MSVMEHGVTIFEFISVTIDVDSDDEGINDHDNEWTIITKGAAGREGGDLPIDKRGGQVFGTLWGGLCMKCYV